jgi:hypothetical protein
LTSVDEARTLVHRQQSMKEGTMSGTTVFGLDTVAWLAEYRRTNAVLIQEAAAVPAPVPERIERPGLLIGELACC